MNWVVAIAGAVIGALLTGWILSMLGVSGILYTILVPVSYTHLTLPTKA